MYRRASLLLALALLSTYASRAQSHGWQQRVAYSIDVDVDTDLHTMDGKARVSYSNNSPDTLHHVFFHLYFNAFQPNSMMAERNRHLPDPDRRVVPRIWNLKPNEIGYHRISLVEQDGQSVPFSINDTVMRVELRRPVPPNTTTLLTLDFDSQIPLTTRRSGRDNRDGIDYSMAQWYPKIAAYDHRGWHADPYVGREFYGPFGSFDVRITLPENYVVGATGLLANANEIGHGYQEQADSLGIRFYSPKRKHTWKFSADNVHDFAWVADPDFIHEKIRAGDTDTELAETSPDLEFHFLYLPQVRDVWSNLRTWVPDIIALFSDLIGPYAWPQFTVAQAGDGGMEYPMINFIAGSNRSPASLFGTTAHEAAHEWFYGMIGSNESDYSWMDEGFTSYFSTVARARILNGRQESHRRALQNIVTSQLLGYADRLSTPADWFQTNAGFGTASYSGGQALLDMLGYVVSDSLRDNFLKQYYREFLFGSPQPTDVERIAEATSGLVLDWFFEQNTNSTRQFDVKVGKIRSDKVAGLYQTSVEIRNVGEAVMPVDVEIVMADGSSQFATIPLSIMMGSKPVPPDWKIAEPWPWTSKEYTLSLALPAKPTRVILDPHIRTLDVNRLNNTSGIPVNLALLKPAAPTWQNYGLSLRPLVTYAHDFGVGAGVALYGSAFLGGRPVNAKVKAWPQVLSSSGESPETSFSYRDVSWFDGLDFQLSTRLGRPGAPTSYHLSTRKHLGIWESSAGISHDLFRSSVLASPTVKLTGSANYLYVDSDRFFKLGRPSLLQKENLVSFHGLVEVRTADFNATVGASMGSSLKEFFACSDPLCAFDQSEAVGFAKMEYSTSVSGFTLAGRSHLRIGVDDLVAHSTGRLGAPTMLESWRSEAASNLLSVLDNPVEQIHLTAVTGFGPVAYHLREESEPRLWAGSTPRGTKLVEASLSVESPSLSSSPYAEPLRVGVYAAAGSVFGMADGQRSSLTDRILTETGPYVTYSVAQLRPIRKWVLQSPMLRNLTLQAIFPLWVNEPGELNESKNADFRWLIGIKL